jgi:acyl carrier protein
MASWTKFIQILEGHVKTTEIGKDSVLFGSGIDISSVRFLEFIMQLEEEFNLDVNVDDLDASVRTVGQLYERIFPTNA